MQTAAFKMHCKGNAFYTTANHVMDLSGNKCNMGRVQKVIFLCFNWRIFIHFACFCFSMSITIMSDGSTKHKNYCKFGLNLRDQVYTEKRYKTGNKNIKVSE